MLVGVVFFVLDRVGLAGPFFRALTGSAHQKLAGETAASAIHAAILFASELRLCNIFAALIAVEVLLVLAAPH